MIGTLTHLSIDVLIALMESLSVKRIIKQEAFFLSKRLTIAQRVKNGMAFMDRKLDRLWFRRIDLVKLDVNRHMDCPLGQTDGDYYGHATQLGLDPYGQRAADLGFIVDPSAEISNEMLHLTRAWRLAIARRLNETQEE